MFSVVLVIALSLKVAIEKSSAGSNMVWLGAGAFIGMGVLMVVQHVRSVKSHRTTERQLNCHSFGRLVYLFRPSTTPNRSKLTERFKWANIGPTLQHVQPQSVLLFTRFAPCRR